MTDTNKWKDKKVGFCKKKKKKPETNKKPQKNKTNKKQKNRRKLDV